jgi:hypothetical protein
MTSFIETHGTITIPQEIIDAYNQWLIALEANRVASAQYQEAVTALNLDKSQARQMSRALSDVSSKYGYDHEKEYKYLRTYGLHKDQYGYQRVPFITAEFVEANYRHDVASHANQKASQLFYSFFKDEGHQTDVQKAWQTLVLATLEALK